MAKRLTISHPLYLDAKFSHREHRAFNRLVATLDRTKHHNAMRLVIKNRANAERIAAMMAAAEARNSN